MSRRSQIQDYLRIPSGDVRNTLALSEALLSAVPDGASSTVTAAAVELHADMDALGVQYDQRHEASAGSQTLCNRRSDRAWGALYYVLYGAARVPDDTPRPKQAQELLDSVFPDGLSFLALSYRAQWVESKRRLQRIEDKKLEQPLADVTGSTSYLEVVRTTHRDFGNALNITEADSTDETPNLTEGIAKVREAMSYYVLQVIAWGQAEGGRNLDKAYLALRPIDVAREEVAHATSSGSQGEGEKAEGEQAEVDANTSVESDATEATAESSDSAPTAEAEAPEEGSGSASA
jgi:hypothetical protein